jgi:AcrR family transcriptional regulator
MAKTIRLSARQAIIEAAFQVLNADPSASLATIATTAGVGRATLHRYFSGRSELIHALALQATEEIDNAANQAAKNARSHADALHRIMRAIIPLVIGTVS